MISAFVGLMMLLVGATAGLAMLAVLCVGFSAVIAAASTATMKALEVVSGRRIRRSWDAPVITTRWSESYQPEPALFWESESILFDIELQSLDLQEPVLDGYASDGQVHQGSFPDGPLPFDDEYETYSMHMIVAI
jgi:hypothetical protein